MALNDFDQWVPEEWGGQIVTAVMRNSVVLGQGRHEAMNLGDTKHVPRTGEVSIANIGKGDPYDEDAAVNDDVVLVTRKLGVGVAIAEEDIRDTATYISVENAKKMSFANSFAKAYDNATLGVSGAESNTASDDRPFTSVYKLVRTTDTTIEPDYTADDNYTATGSGGTTYTTLRAAATKYEVGSYFDESDTIVIASPAYKDKLRGVLDGENRPIFIETALVDSTTGRTQVSLFNYPVFWSQGARVSGAMTPAPTGKPLLIFCNKSFLINGDKWPVESQLIPPSISKEDEAFLKMRFRGGFAGGHPSAFSVHEDNS
jgi:hypothetical protein